MKLRWPVAVFLFALGAVASLVGDHSHIVTGTTEYLSYAVPFVWSRPVWFPILVALATVSIAGLRLHLPAVRTSVTARQGIAGVAAVVRPWRPGPPPPPPPPAWGYNYGGWNDYGPLPPPCLSGPLGFVQVCA